MYYLHMMYLRGVFLSDWYFMECFIWNLHGAYNSTTKPLMLHFVRRVAVDVALPHYFQPANILSYMATAATNVGVAGVTPLQTPKEFAATYPFLQPGFRSLYYFDSLSLFHTDYITNEKPVNGAPMKGSNITDWSSNSFQGPLEKGALEHVAGSL